jgi:metal-responsive CopG/Arc/MetJ family transcriptional regulator
MVHHMVVARKQVLVQLDDELVARLDELAAHLAVSRSELLRRAATALLEADRIAEAELATIAAYLKQPEDPDWVATATRLAAETAPVW